MLSALRLISGLVFLGGFLANCTSSDVAYYCSRDGGKLFIDVQGNSWGGKDFGANLNTFSENDIEFFIGPFSARIVRNHDNLRLDPVFSEENDSYNFPIMPNKDLLMSPRTIRIVVSDKGFIEEWENYVDSTYTETFTSCSHNKAAADSII